MSDVRTKAQSFLDCLNTNICQLFLRGEADLLASVVLREGLHPQCGQREHVMSGELVKEEGGTKTDRRRLRH